MINFFSLPLWFPTINNIKIIYFKNFIRRSIKYYLYSDNNNRNNLANIFKNSDSLIDQCMTFLFAGHETTASSITFTLLLLAKYPHYQELVSQGDEQIIKAIYKESLRLYPPAYMLVRQVKEKTIFNGFNLKAKDQIIIGVKQIHRSEKYYDKPNDFVPERFLNKNENYAFLPFGIGAKSTPFNENSICFSFFSIFNVSAKAKELAKELHIEVQDGVYLGLQGPTFETLSEYKMVKLLGADCVGMSTVPEVIVARHMDLETFGLSVITDMGNEESIESITHEEVLEAAKSAEPQVRRLIRELIEKY